MSGEFPGAYDASMHVFSFLTGGAEIGKERKQQIADVTAELIKALKVRRAARVALGRAVHRGGAEADLPELGRQVAFAEAAVNALVERLEELL